MRKDLNQLNPRSQNSPQAFKSTTHVILALLLSVLFVSLGQANASYSEKISATAAEYDNAGSQNFTSEDTNGDDSNDISGHRLLALGHFAQQTFTPSDNSFCALQSYRQPHSRAPPITTR